jgi:alpha-galactosidase
MVTIAIIGAGSHVFSRRLITDILSVPTLRASTIRLMDIDPQRLGLMTHLATKMVRQWGFPTNIESTVDRRTALEGADYVITSIRVGGQAMNRVDLEIPMKYGITQGIGDTIGPGGVFYGLRHIPVLLDVCHDMETLCPDAWLINYTNPMSMLCWAMNDHSHIKNIGLCHSVQGTHAELARYIGAPADEVSSWVAGINHMAWFLEFLWRGTDAYPLLREKFRDVEVYSRNDAHWAGADIVRAAIFKAFGYFNTESSQHMSEYVPYFRKRRDLFDQYRLVVGLDWLRERQQRIAREDEQLRRRAVSDEAIPLQRSNEYCSYIIESIETNAPLRINANVKNTGLITNLPQGCCVEVPCLVDERGVHPCYMGTLPPQCAALNRSNINVHELGVKAAVEKDRTLVFQALLVDPLTSAVLTIDETRSMVDEMLNAEAQYLEDFK